MFQHIRFSLWALRTLWGLKTIVLRNRLLLWRKSVRLYFSLLAFCDKERPTAQLQRAMISAVLSALYDYSTDWIKARKPEDSLFFQGLGQLLQGHPRAARATQLAQELFRLDRANLLPESGLERGSMALLFYHLVINSRWMSAYVEDEIAGFGRKLQIVDDLLDLENDRRFGHTNCLLATRPVQFIQELREFLVSDFFLELERHSRVYRLLRARCEEKLRARQPTVTRQLFATTDFRIIH